jgi:SAM-dependent methyltransferase
MDWQQQCEAWSAPPIAGSNVSSVDILAMSSEQLNGWINRVWPQQYNQPSNWKGLYRRLLKLDTTVGKDILDFGCGFGFDALSLAYHNRVGVADIVQSNIDAAKRILGARGFTASQSILVGMEPPYLVCKPVDIFHCSGVLHHIPWRVKIMIEMAQLLKPGGEIRAMLYSDKAWRDIVGRLPPIDYDTRKHPQFDEFVRTMDAVGSYADWFSEEKLNYEVGGFLSIVSFDYIRHDAWYAVATMKRVGDESATGGILA